MRISTCTLAVLAAVWASASWAVVPNVSDSVIQSQNTILKDPKIQKIYQDLSSPESAKDRFNTHGTRSNRFPITRRIPSFC